MQMVRTSVVKHVQSISTEEKDSVTEIASGRVFFNIKKKQGKLLE